MSGPTVVFTTKLGAMGVAGAFAAAYANKKYPVMSQEQLQLQTIRNHQETGSNWVKHVAANSSKKKLRIGHHHNDLHVLMFVMGKD